MNRYICTKCGRYSYSAARLEDTDDLCVYPDCDGIVTKAPDDAATSDPEQRKPTDTIVAQDDRLRNRRNAK